MMRVFSVPAALALCCILATACGRPLAAATNITNPVLSGNHVWTPQGSPYYIQTDLTIPAGSSLIVEPGVFVRFAQFKKLTVQGLLHAVGTQQNQIHFRAMADPYPNFGLVPRASWGHIMASGALADVRLEHCRIMYGGNNMHVPNALVAAENGAALAVSDCVLSQCFGVALHAVGVSGLTLNDNTIQYNTGHGIYLSNCADTTITGGMANFSGQVPGKSGLVAESCSGITVNGVTFNNNTTYGLRMIGCTGVSVSECSFPFNMDGAVHLSGCQGLMGLPECSGYGKVVYSNCTLTQNAAWDTPGLDPEVQGVFAVSSGVLLQVGPAMVVKFAPDARLDVQGSLHAHSGSTQPIYFTSLRDRNVESAAYPPWSDPPAARGDWQGIRLSGSASSADLLYCILRYAGGAGPSSPAAIANSEGDLKVDRCDITESAADGLVLDSLNSNIANSIIAYNTGYGSRALMAFPGSPSILISHTDLWENAAGNLHGFPLGSFSTLLGEDPLFVDVPEGDYELLPGSPCIKSGLIFPLPDESTQVDLGAIEYEEPYETDRISEIKGLPERRRVLLHGPIVSAEPAAFYGEQFWVQQIDRACGIKVTGDNTPERGDILDILGRKTSDCLGACIVAQKVTVLGHQPPPIPLAMRNNWIWTDLRVSSGLENYDLLVSSWGRVTEKSWVSLMIDDGGRIPALYGQIGLPVGANFDMPESLNIGDYVKVTGICRARLYGEVEPTKSSDILMRDPADLEILNP